MYAPARLLLILAAVMWIDPAARVSAQQIMEPTPQQKAHCDTFADSRLQTFCMRGYSVAALRFPDAARQLEFFTATETMAVYKPEGNGRFPALLLLHTCGPVDGQHTRYWAKRALENGYVVFVVDSWTQRNMPNGVCRTPVRTGFNPVAIRARDAYDALEHLARFEFVDSSRVGAMGYSHGGRITYQLVSKSVADLFSPRKLRFAAAVAFYGECYNRSLKLNRLWPDMDVPLLALLGELDEDGDPAECVPRFQAAKDKGSPIEWHVYPKIGHAWDQSRFRINQRVQITGGPTDGVLFTYDSRITDDSGDRALSFLARFLK